VERCNQQSDGGSSQRIEPGALFKEGRKEREDRTFKEGQNRTLKEDIQGIRVRNGMTFKERK
jgi:hypothetical protein